LPLPLPLPLPFLSNQIVQNDNLKYQNDDRNIAMKVQVKVSITCHFDLSQQISNMICKNTAKGNTKGNDCIDDIDDIDQLPLSSLPLSKAMIEESIKDQGWAVTVYALQEKGRGVQGEGQHGHELTNQNR
jgi:hypothetical protein